MGGDGREHRMPGGGADRGLGGGRAFQGRASDPYLVDSAPYTSTYAMRPLMLDNRLVATRPIEDAGENARRNYLRAANH